MGQFCLGVSKDAAQGLLWPNSRAASRLGLSGNQGLCTFTPGKLVCKGATASHARLESSRQKLPQRVAAAQLSC